MRVAAYSGTRNIYGDMITSAKSLIASSAVDEVWMLAEDDTVGDVPDIIKVRNVSKQTYFKSGGPNMNSPFTYMAMMRIALCHELDCPRVLSLDHDTIVVPGKDATPAFDFNVDDYYFAAAREAHRCYASKRDTKELLYTNIGVVLYNLDKMRDGKADECIGVMNRRFYSWVEQDVANFLCQGYILNMPGEYNACQPAKDGDTPLTKYEKGKEVIKHWAGIKHSKWANLPDFKYWRDMSWSDVMELHDEMVERYA